MAGTSSSGSLQPAQHRLDAGEQLTAGVGLGDVVVGADLQPDDLVDLAVLGGEHDHRHARALAQRAADVDAGEAGQHEVQQHQVGAAAVELLQRVGAGLGHRDLVALLAQQVGQRVGERLLVLHHQDACHRVTSRESGCPAGRARPGGNGGRGRGRRSAGGRGGQPHGEGGAAALLAPHGDVAAVVGADVLDDREAEAGAAGGPRARRVDAVEPLEDAGLLGVRDALALVADVDLDQVVDAPDADRDAGPAAGVGDRVADQVADGRGEQLGVAEHLGVAGQRDGQLDLAGLGDEAALLDRVRRPRGRRRPAPGRAGCRPPAAGRGRRSPGPAWSAGRSRPASAARTARPPRGRRWRPGPPRPAGRCPRPGSSARG